VGPPSGGNPQSYIPRESQGKLRFEITEKWIDWMIPGTRSVREFDTLVTLEQAKGGAIGFTMGSYKFGMASSFVAIIKSWLRVVVTFLISLSLREDVVLPLICSAQKLMVNRCTSTLTAI